ncbi:MAG: putative manganese transporter [Bacteroidales bacterium]|nr:putative manganese transporter [Bacteroidales bacterium]MCF8388248.1 putative manganese transporter [Bacteroidales bacterium]MCF8398988.1 putative manganese transporter [Bacteroidales bacterium]
MDVLLESVQILKRAVMITGFVFVMMLVIEYINVQTRGIWQGKVLDKKWKQYLLAASLGAIPGCMGAFTAVALFSHRMISFGAIVTAMIATSGDEAFVMLAMFPQTTLVLTLILFALGILAGYLTDRFYTPHKILEKFSGNRFPLHAEEKCRCFQKEKFIPQITRPSVYRLLLILTVLTLFVLILTGILAGNAKMWVRISLLLAVAFSLFIVVSVPEHFLKDHLWGHVAKQHVPRIFYWTFGTLLVFGILLHYVDLNELLANNLFVVLVFAILIGIIPESGPHLVFVTLFAQGSIPFSILMASSISQDGHGSLPLLAESKRAFLAVKLVNVIIALVFGLIGLSMGI